MAATTSASFWLTLLSLVLCVSEEQRIIPAVPGQNVSLPCKALNNGPVLAVEWNRTDMKKDEYVLLYRDDQFDPENQHPSYKNRVDLQLRQMKDGDVSLILNNVTTDDSGTYECYVFQTKRTNRRKRSHLGNEPICIIRLDVDPSGHTSGHKEEGGDMEGGDKEGGDKDRSVGLIVGLIVLAALVVGVVVFLIIRKRRQDLNPGPYRPPPDPGPQQVEMSGISFQLDSECPAAGSSSSEDLRTDRINNAGHPADMSNHCSS